MDEILKRIASFIDNNSHQLIIGISGHGASGKTTFANQLIDFLDGKEINYINTDPYIIDSGLRKYSKLKYEYKSKQYSYKITACHPTAHNVSYLERDINMIKNDMDFYTMQTNYCERELISSSKNITIVEGMSVAFMNLDFFDLTVYLYTDSETEFNRRKTRDISERGTNLNYLQQSHEHRRIQYDLFMHSYRQKFDVVINNSNDKFLVEKDNKV